MTGCRLWRELCGHGPERSRRDKTDALIDDAERTRRELTRITERLAAHVAALKLLTRAYAREHERPTSG